ncbi:MAG TPA: cyanophycin synthetase, partial [SAR86 cluster bacterium]|nr:cyanophycin synthetase [SAR86 cluster bacterium]
MVFQSHRYTRTKDLFKECIEVLAKVDNLILLDVYSAGEEPIQGINSVEIKNKLLGNGFNSISLCNEPNGNIEILGNFLDKDSIVIMQGAGDISEISSEIMNQCAIET